MNIIAIAQSLFLFILTVVLGVLVFHDENTDVFLAVNCLNTNPTKSHIAIEYPENLSWFTITIVRTFKEFHMF